MAGVMKDGDKFYPQVFQRKHWMMNKDNSKDLKKIKAKN